MREEDLKDETCSSRNRVCPAQAISKDNGKVTDKSKCISWMRCVSICPVHARSLNKVTVSVVASAIKKACSVQKSNELFL